MRKRWIRIWSIVLVLSMLLVMMPTLAGAVAEEPVINGTCGNNGDNVTWNLDVSTGQLTIQGIGEMHDYSTTSTVPWYALREQIKSVVIKNGVTYIGGYTLGALDSEVLEKVIMPSSVTSFASQAWATAGGYYQSYSKLITAGPKGGNYNYEFEWRTEIPNHAFQIGGIEKIVLPDTIVKIGNHALHAYDLIDVNLPNGLKEIGDFAFCGTSLTNIEIPDSVTTIGENAFQHSDKLESVVLPKDLSTIPYMMCYACSSLKNVEWPSNFIVDRWAFAHCGFIDLTLPQGVRSIGEYAFYSCDNLKSIFLLSTVESIGQSAFQDCGVLRKVELPDSLTVLEGAIFSGCSALEEIHLSNALVEIEGQAFYKCNALVSIQIPSNVVNIGKRAFESCHNLVSIILPESLKTINNYAFNNCTSLTDVYYTGSEADWNAISISADNNYLTNATIHYNSTGPDAPGTGGSESGITSMVALFKSYDESVKQAAFGSNPTPYIYQITDETVLPDESIDSLLGKTVLVRYKSGEYGAPDMLTRYVLSISPVSTASDVLSRVGQESISLGLLGGKSYNLDRANGTVALEDLENHIGDFAVCYLLNNAIVDVQFPQQQTGTFTTGTQDDVTIDGVQYPVAFTDPAPYLSAIDLWFGQTVEYWMVDGIIYNIRLPDYETTICKRLEKIQDNKAYFHDGSNYQMMDSSSIDDSLVGRWVTVTLTTSAGGGTMLSNMCLFQPQISIEIEMLDDRNIRLKDNKYSYDGSNYVPSSQFEIGYQITIKSKVSGVSGSDLAMMQTDPTLAFTLNDLEITPPNGFNLGWRGNGDIPNVAGTTILPGQTKVAQGFVRPGMLYFVDEEDASVTEIIQVKLETSVGEYKDDVAFTIMNLDYEPPKTKEEALNSKRVKDLIEKASDELNELDIDSGIIITDLSLVKLDFGIDDNSLSRLKRELLTEVIMSSAPEDSLSDQIADNMMSSVFGEYKSPVSGSKYAVPLQYVFETPDYGMLTVQFTCNVNSFTLSGSKYALYATVDYKVLQQDKDSGDKTWPSYKKAGDFAQITFTDIKAYTNAAYDAAKEAIKEAYDDAWGEQADQIADFLFGDVVKAILKESNISFSKEIWKIMTWPTENMSIACPVDIFIYDENGNLCGSIEGNQVTKASTEFGLSVNGDVKYVTGLRDSYKVIYEATDNGSMDIAITEYTGYESPLRAITFKAVPLVQDGTYTQNIADEVLAEVNSYKLVSDAETDIMPDDKVVLIGFTSDETEQEETPNPTPEPTPTPEPDNNSEESSGSSSSTNRYTVSVASGIDNGSICVSPSSRAEAGDTVTITVTPDEGYELDELVVYDADGDEVDLDDEGDGAYTFEMPKSDVEIEVSFARISDADDETPVAAFVDVADSDWYADAVQYVFANGLMAGTSDTTFSPNATTTRAMIVTILYRLEGTPAVTGTTAFTDVAAGQYYADAVAWAAQNGIVSGTSATTFSPDGVITREQMAAILYRYAQHKDYDVTAKADLSVFTDAAQVSTYATDAMAWANASGLISGTSATTLSPAGSATRAQVATILMRFCENIAK